MKTLAEFKSKIDFLLTDIDDTLTDEGRLGPEAYDSLWKLHSAGVSVIPVTGRPAGWCEMIARQWPVAGVVGENGAFYFRYHKGKMRRDFEISDAQKKKYRQKLDDIHVEILRDIPGAGIASDQFCRLFDLAVDFCEDVPRLPREQVEKIVAIFKKHGAHAKVSSIHVNGWFGNYDKVTKSFDFLKKEFSLTPDSAQLACGFVGDSPNDEPLFAALPHSFGVANVRDFADQIQKKPQYVSHSRGGRGFSEIADRILNLKMNQRA